MLVFTVLAIIAILVLVRIENNIRAGAKWYDMDGELNIRKGQNDN